MPNFQKDGCGTKHRRNGHHIKEEARSVGFTVHPASGKRYYLWILLNVVCGATSFEDLHIVDGRSKKLAKPKVCLKMVKNGHRPWKKPVIRPQDADYMICLHQCSSSTK
jgi:hypothetical protein